MNMMIRNRFNQASSMASCYIMSHCYDNRSKNFNIYFLSLTVVFCTIFYLIGIWQDHPSNLATRFAGIPCIPLRNSTQHLVIGLNFEAYHAAERELYLSSNAANAVHIPMCDTRFSEYTPCEDAGRSMRHSKGKLVQRERHCPIQGEELRCRIPAPYGYKSPFRWPQSRDWVWYANVPHKELTVAKADQNWVRFKGDKFKFPGGGTMFRHGADAYIDDIGKIIDLRGGSIRTAIDTGCGVASWGGYLLSRTVLTVSFAPKDQHLAQVQFALERGLPALLGVLATTRLPYPSRAFDMAHCSRCLIHWDQYDGMYLMEVDRILRPGGYWILSGPPINWERHWRGWNRTRESLKADQISIDSLARTLCWKKFAQKGDIAVWQKPYNHIHCKHVLGAPSFCQDQDPDKAWYTKLEACLTPLPEVSGFAGGELARWPGRLNAVPPRVRSGSLSGISGEIFRRDSELWRRRVSYYKSKDKQLAEKGRYRNFLDMNSFLGGFAAALVGDPVWVMNIVPVEAGLNTLGVIYERGLIGTYQNWCEAMSTYPRSYDFIHADAVFSLYNDRCGMEDILIEVDRLLRPKGSVIFRDDVDMLVKMKRIIDGMQWEGRIVDHEDGPLKREKLLLATKLYWTAPKP